VNFALLAYAAGLASSRYVSLLRQREEEKSPKPSRKEKKKQTKEGPAHA